MIRYLAFACVKIAGVALAWCGFNFLLPMFATPRVGMVNNGDHAELDLFLPDWLFWFSTNYDNALTGDDAHKLRHERPWEYWPMVCWLYRNPFKGADWSILGAPVDQAQIRRTETGWIMGDYFQIVLRGGFVIGWLIDASEPPRVPDKRAAFVFGR